MRRLSGDSGELIIWTGKKLNNLSANRMLAFEIAGYGGSSDEALWNTETGNRAAGVKKIDNAGRGRRIQQLGI